jgi:SAM-dependent methyltransferase
MTTSASAPPHTACNLCNRAVPAEREAVWRKDGLDVVDCPACGLLFRRDLPSAAELAEIYAGEYFRRPEEGDAQGYLDYIGDEDLHRLAARKRLRRLARHALPGRLLDVGAAAGFFVDEARRRGWQAEGIDVSTQMSAFGRDRLGLELATGVFERSDYQSGAYDCVTMWDYIEHAIDPAAAFRSAHRVLRPDGIVALSTGDVGSLLARISGERWHLLTPRHHNFYFSGDTMRRYLEENAFEVLYIGHPSSPYSLRYCVHKLRTAAPRSGSLRRLSDWVAERRIGDLPIPANLWDVMTVVARKAG